VGVWRRYTEERGRGGEGDGEGGEGRAGEVMPVGSSRGSMRKAVQPPGLYGLVGRKWSGLGREGEGRGGGGQGTLPWERHGPGVAPKGVPRGAGG